MWEIKQKATNKLKDTENCRVVIRGEGDEERLKRVKYMMMEGDWVVNIQCDIQVGTVGRGDYRNYYNCLLYTSDAADDWLVV